MKTKSRIKVVKIALLGAIDQAREEKALGTLFSQLQNIIRENQKTLIVALPETVDSLREIASLTADDYCLECSNTDLDALQRWAEARFPDNWKGVAERLDSIAQELLLYKVKRKCSACDAPEMSIMVEGQTGRWVYYCAECDYVESFIGIPTKVDSLRTPKKNELEAKGMSCRKMLN